ncbi:MAG: AbrB/MazE/SpoVT family DNA-binding domain-containing protein [Gemmatimonadetes bacterium]|nr:AbrB/MazE/SpoVT family DNA-binding domain-containing protein [Gemmatimonadota bacterium]
MSKVTSKLQVTIPKAIAERYGIRPGAEVEWVPAGDAIRLLPPGAEPEEYAVEERLELFDQASARQRARQRARQHGREASGKRRRGRPAERGWRREDLYTRETRGRPG